MADAAVREGAPGGFDRSWSGRGDRLNACPTVHDGEHRTLCLLHGWGNGR
jgi:hypothetical protein